MRAKHIQQQQQSTAYDRINIWPFYIFNPLLIPLTAVAAALVRSKITILLLFVHCLLLLLFMYTFAWSWFYDSWW